MARKNGGSIYIGDPIAPPGQGISIGRMGTLIFSPKNNPPRAAIITEDNAFFIETEDGANTLITEG